MAKVDPRIWKDAAEGQTTSFLVLLADQPDTRGAARDKPDRKKRGHAVVAALRECADRSQASVIREIEAHHGTCRSYWIVNLLAVEGKRGLVEALARREDVKAIESDKVFLAPAPQPSEVQAAAFGVVSGVEGNLQHILAPDVWALGPTGQGIVYANADTGVQWDHPALKSQYRGWDGATANHNYNWWDAIHRDINGNGTNPKGFSSPVPVDDVGHGTHTMGIGVGDDHANNQIGVAPGARWISCRNMDEGVGRPSTYLECMQFFMAPTDLAGHNPDPDRRPDCISNSYGCPPNELCAPNTMQTALENLRAAGIFMAVSAGNRGPSCGTISDPPALDASVITVGATDDADQIAGFSSRGPVVIDGSNRPKPNLVAPGVNVRSAYPDNGYSRFSGTSMAAPEVAGAVALLWSAYPHIRGNVDYTQSLLEQTAKPLTTAQGCAGDSAAQVPNNVYGHGRLDVLAAYFMVNRPPFASNQTVILSGDSFSSIALKGSDPEHAPLAFEIVRLPSHGLVSRLDSATGILTYTPAHAYAGLDSFVFHTSDGMFTSSNATLTVVISAPTDTDQDGLPNYWEQRYQLDSVSPADAQLDPDEDGLSNYQEYLANTNPRDRESDFRILGALRSSNGSNLVVWNSVGATRYRVQYSDGEAKGRLAFHDIVLPAEFEIDSSPVGSASSMSFIDDFTRSPPVPPNGQRYYRIRLLQE